MFIELLEELISGDIRMLKKKLIYLEVLASLLLYGCSPSAKQTQAAAAETTIGAETTAEAEEPEIPYIEAADSFAGGSGTAGPDGKGE